MYTQVKKKREFATKGINLPVLFLPSEEVILNEDRTTEEERRYIMEARKRALQKRKKLRTLGKSRSTESEEEEEEEEGEMKNSVIDTELQMAKIFSLLIICKVYFFSFKFFQVH